MARSHRLLTVKHLFTDTKVCTVHIPCIAFLRTLVICLIDYSENTSAEEANSRFDIHGFRAGEQLRNKTEQCMEIVIEKVKGVLHVHVHCSGVL